MGSSWFRSACSLILIILNPVMGVRVSIAEVQGVIGRNIIELMWLQAFISVAVVMTLVA